MNSLIFFVILFIVASSVIYVLIDRTGDYARGTWFQDYVRKTAEKLYSAIESDPNDTFAMSIYPLSLKVWSFAVAFIFLFLVFIISISNLSILVSILVSLPVYSLIFLFSLMYSIANELDAIIKEKKGNNTDQALH